MKKYLFILLAAAMFTSCSDLTELNKDLKNPEVVPASTLFANATVSFFDFMSSTNVNVNNFRLWAQHWAQVSYSDESNFELVERNVNGRTFNTMYTTVLRDMLEARTFVEADINLTDENKTNQLAILDVMEVVSYTILIDIFGNVPYSEAFGDDVTPAYDDDKEVYYIMIDKLSAAIGNLGGSAGDFGDLIYGGNADAWKMFANSYMLRLAIRIADEDNAKAKALFEAAAPGAFASNADNFAIAYEGSTPNTNPLWEDLVQSGRSDFVSANTLVDIMNGLDDPRRAYFLSNNVVDADGNVVYVGGTFGDVNSFTANSQVNDVLKDPTLPGTVMGYTELRFLMADAAARGFSVSGSAEEHYNAAITNSIMEWGGTQEEADAYLAQANVAYGTAAGDWKEKIGVQKWIAMYNQGFEAWSSYRLYDAPEVNVAVAAGTVSPYRYTYPVAEYSVNQENVEAAGDAMGGDDKFSRVFWDKN